MISGEGKTERRLLVVCAILPAIFVAALGFFSRITEKDLDVSIKWVPHTLKVITHIRAISGALAAAETSQRGFLLTTNAAYPKSYREAVNVVGEEMRELRTFIADNPGQQETLKKLSPLVEERLNQLALTVADGEAGRIQEAIAFVQSGAGKITADQITAELTLMEKEEKQLLASRQAEMSQRFAAHSRITYTLLALSVLFGAGILFLLTHLARSRALLTICAWSKTIEYQGEWLTFEQYMLRRFDVKITHGMSPDAAQKFLDEADSIGEKKF